MQQYIIPVNNEAFSRALVAVVGEKVSKRVVTTYKALDDAMAFGYAQGKKEAADAAASIYTPDEGAARKAYADGYDAGYDAGYEAGFKDGAETSAYDDGYIDGVSDARVNPSDADARVAELCSEDFDDSDYYGDEDDFYEGDSGDENDFLADPMLSR